MKIKLFFLTILSNISLLTLHSMLTNSNAINNYDALMQVSGSQRLLKMSLANSMAYSKYTGNTYYLIGIDPDGTWVLGYILPDLSNALREELLFGNIDKVWVANNKIFVIRTASTGEGRFFIGDDVAQPTSSSFQQLSLQGIVSKVNNGWITPTSDPNIADFFIYNNVNNGQVLMRQIDTTTKTFTAYSKVFNLNSSHDAVTAFNYNHLDKSLDFLAWDSTVADSTMYKIYINSQNMTSWDAKNFRSCNRLFSEGDNYYGLNPTGGSTHGLIYGKKNELGSELYASIGIINQVSMFNDRFILATANNSLWYIDRYGIPKRYLNFWRSNTEENIFSDSDDVGNIPDNAMESSRLLLKIIPNIYSTRTLSTLYATVSTKPSKELVNIVEIFLYFIPFMFLIIAILIFVFWYRNNPFIKKKKFY